MGKIVASGPGARRIFRFADIGRKARKRKRAGGPSQYRASPSVRSSAGVSSTEVRQDTLGALKSTIRSRVATKSIFSRSGIFENRRLGGTAKPVIIRPSKKTSL